MKIGKSELLLILFNEEHGFFLLLDGINRNRARKPSHFHRYRAGSASHIIHYRSFGQLQPANADFTDFSLGHGNLIPDKCRIPAVRRYDLFIGSRI